MTAAGIPNPQFRCDMRARACRRPAQYVVEAKVRIGSHDDWEPLYWLCCDRLACVAAANLHAELIGQHVDTRELTVSEAEAITGYYAAVTA